jgi:transposase-like protein
VARPKYSKEFQQAAVERLRGSENITKLAVELGVSRRQLYRWRDELDPEEAVVGKPPLKNSRSSTLRKEVNHLKRVLAEKTLEVDFFKNALQKVAARRQGSSSSGAKASTTKFEK